MASDLSWERSIHKNLGVDMSFLNNRLAFSADFYIRDTKDMLTAGIALPATYGADSPKMNSADLRTKGYELSLNWRDEFQLLRRPFSYSVTLTFNDYVSNITKFDNPDRSFAKKYYEGMRWGEIWGYRIDGLFASDEEARNYPVDQTTVNEIINASAGAEKGLRAGDLKFRDLDDNNVISIGKNTVDDPGDREIIGNSQPRYHYGATLALQWAGIDFSIFFQGIGRQDWYPAANALAFWGPYARPYATYLPKKAVDRACELVELLGALALLQIFCRDYGLRGVWMSVFHSVSAFCNAGFDILGRTDSFYPSLTAYAADPLGNFVIMLLIIVGGIGFLTWDDVCTHGLHLRRYRMQRKVILSMTALLIALPAVLFFLTDFADLPIGERILASLFQSVTPRTAGYNTVDLTEMTDASQAVTILLMLTGGAPGSTAGGMKVTTLAVLIANAVAAFRRREDPQLFHRRLEHSAVRNAAAILLLYLGLTFAGAAAISAAEELPLGACLYETASAAGTVGLTLGLTPQLGVLSQSILILLMFFGRVGGLTLIYAAFSGHDLTYARYPQEKITVG